MQRRLSGEAEGHGVAGQLGGVVDGKVEEGRTAWTTRGEGEREGTELGAVGRGWVSAH
jgi:hypothetical protein